MKENVVSTFKELKKKIVLLNKQSQQRNGDLKKKEILIPKSTISKMKTLHYEVKSIWEMVGR